MEVIENLTIEIKDCITFDGVFDTEGYECNVVGLKELQSRIVKTGNVNLIYRSENILENLGGFYAWDFLDSLAGDVETSVELKYIHTGMGRNAWLTSLINESVIGLCTMINGTKTDINVYIRYNGFIFEKRTDDTDWEPIGIDECSGTYVLLNDDLSITGELQWT